MVKKDFSQATHQQLFEMAKDETVRLRDRYAAARELQKRRKLRGKQNQTTKTVEEVFEE